MSSRFSFGFFLFLSFFYSQFSFGMLFTGEVLISPDKSRYITLLGHHHRQTGWDHEGRQIDELIAICKEGVKEGRKFHILYEKIDGIARFLLPERSMLGDIEKDFANAQVPDCTFENIEIRDVACAAKAIFKGKFLSPKMTCDGISKTLDELVFQDLFDEFEKHAVEIDPFTLKIVEDHPECPNADLIHFKYSNAREHMDHMKQYLREIGLSGNANILAVSLAHKDDCLRLFWAIRYAFNDLLELCILRKVLQLDPEVQPIVIAGAWHTEMVYQTLDNLRWQLRLYKGNLYAETPVPLDYQTIRSFVLNETNWERTTKEILSYWVSVKTALGSKYTLFANLILSRYC